MKTKLTLGWLQQRLDLTINYHRLKMTYGCVSSGDGWWNAKVNRPIESNSDYWIQVMGKVHPWNQLFGCYMQFADLPPETEIWLDAEVIGKILTATGEFK